MKMKSLAMLAMSGLMLTSIAYIAPVMADDNDGSTMQMPSDTSGAMGSMPMPGQSTQSGTGTSQQQNDMNSIGSSNNNSSSSNADSPDGGSPDTATGDDDY